MTIGRVSITDKPKWPSKTTFPSVQSRSLHIVIIYEKYQSFKELGQIQKINYPLRLVNKISLKIKDTVYKLSNSVCRSNSMDVTTNLPTNRLSFQQSNLLLGGFQKLCKVLFTFFLAHRHG